MDRKNTYNINQEELEETFSFCNLSLEKPYLDDQSLTFNHSQNSSSHNHNFFEFPFIPNSYLNNNKTNDIVFCGKLIKEQEFVKDDGDKNRYLFPLSSTKQFNNNKNDLSSLHLVNSKPNSSLPTKSFRSYSCSSFRKHKILIGITKVPPKMELSDLKKRQSKRNHPLPMFPLVATGDMAVVNTNDGCGAGGRRNHRCSLLRCKALFLSALAKVSLGCIPHV